MAVLVLPVLADDLNVPPYSLSIINVVVCPNARQTNIAKGLYLKGGYVLTAHHVVETWGDTRRWLSNNEAPRLESLDLMDDQALDFTILAVRDVAGKEPVSPSFSAASAPPICRPVTRCTTSRTTPTAWCRTRSSSASAAAAQCCGPHSHRGRRGAGLQRVAVSRQDPEAGRDDHLRRPYDTTADRGHPSAKAGQTNEKVVLIESTGQAVSAVLRYSCGRYRPR